MNKKQKWTILWLWDDVLAAEAAQLRQRAVVHFVDYDIKRSESDCRLVVIVGEPEPSVICVFRNRNAMQIGGMQRFETNPKQVRLPGRPRELEKSPAWRQRFLEQRQNFRAVAAR
jgi:hypothetical protein